MAPDLQNVLGRNGNIVNSQRFAVRGELRFHRL
jgi:hypothetical protein